MAERSSPTTRPKSSRPISGGDTLDLRFAEPAEAQSAATLAGNVPGARDVAVDANTLRFVAAGGEALATTMSRPAILVGRALKELAPLLVQALIIIVVPAPFGLTLHPLTMLVGLGLFLIFGIGVAALSYALAMATKRDGSMFYLVSHSVALPLMLLGGVLLPITNAPQWLFIASRFNPRSYLVDAERALFRGELFTLEVGYGFAVALVVAIVRLTIGSLTIRKASL